MRVRVRVRVRVSTQANRAPRTHSINVNDKKMVNGKVKALS